MGICLNTNYIIIYNIECNHLIDRFIISSNKEITLHYIYNIYIYIYYG